MTDRELIQQGAEAVRRYNDMVSVLLCMFYVWYCMCDSFFFYSLLHLRGFAIFCVPSYLPCCTHTPPLFLSTLLRHVLTISRFRIPSLLPSQ